MLDGLQELGLSINEAKIYAHLVKQGRSSISYISQSIGVSRRNVYDAIARVQKRGLVFKVFSKKESLYEAVNPEKLREIIREKELKLESFLPELRKLYKKETEEEETYIYKGIDGLKSCMREILEQKKPVYTIGAKGFWFDARIKDYTKGFLKEAKKQKIAFQHIFDIDVKNEIPEVLKNIPKPHKFFNEKYSTQACLIIFGNQVHTFTGVHPGELGEDITVFVISNRAVANSHKKWFESLWESL